MSDRKPMQTNLCADKRLSSSYDALNNMRRNNQLCDIEFAIGGKKISAHKAILASHSNFFNNMFTGKFKDAKFLEVQNTEITPNSFELLIDFLYTTKLTIKDSNVQELLRASIVLILNDVKEECLKYIEQTIDIENFMELKIIASINKSRDLYELFLSYVLKNYKNIVVLDVFLTFSFELMMKLIQSEDLCVKEEEAYESTMLWLKHDLTERIQYLPELFKSIRLSVMTIDYLDNIVQEEDLIKSDITCMRYLCHAYKMHRRKNSMNNESSLTNNIAYRKYNQTSQSSLFIPGNQNFKNNTIEKCLPRDKYKNNNGQRQSRFSDACVIEEIDEDIFKLSKEYSLAHCVAEDLRMNEGIAVDFKNIFGGVGKLIDQKLKIGDVGIVKRHDQYALYLVTKKTSNGKPTMITMEKALHSLLNKMKEYNLTKLGIPTIGCGLGRLDWSDTKSLINKIFSGSGIRIVVCVPSKLLDSKKPPRLTVNITPKNLWEMETETTIILFIDLEETCNKNWTDHIVDKVDAKYPFKENLLKDVRKRKPNPGDITIYNVKNEVIVCMFTTENTYYGSLENGFKTIDHTFKGYQYLAIQGGTINYPSDNFQRIKWIELIFRTVIHHSELFLCGNVTQNNYQVYYDEYCKSVLPMNNSF